MATLPAFYAATARLFRGRGVATALWFGHGVWPLAAVAASFNGHSDLGKRPAMISGRGLAMMNGRIV